MKQLLWQTHQTIQVMLEMQQETKNLQYQLKGIGAGVEFHGGFWAEYVYVTTPKGPVARILSNGAVFMDKGWYEKQNDAARYLVDEFIKYLLAVFRL